MDFDDIPAATEQELRYAYAASVNTEAAIRNRFRNSPGGTIPRDQCGAIEQLDREYRFQEAIENERRNRRNSKAKEL